MQPEMVTVTIDGVEVQVPKGTNLIEAAKKVGVEIPHYCYHPSLSIAGNCRMCQVHIEGGRKLGIACNTGATDGMVVETQETNAEVADAQRATLEFLLINHPLDCTVCDQAGHCKLQDYYYEYNGKPSRFKENKVKSVKAEVFGPEVIYDGERCIVCTRCVRFCDEVTESSELGVFNRGDKSVIGIHPNKELDNPLSGCVVDLCPVGALTHRRWRFNTRIWYTNEEKTICAGCSTGCNALVAVRDNQVVQVKARYNSEVNQEWLCDEGRYGFERFQPQKRFVDPLARKEGRLQQASLSEALQAASSLQNANEGAVFLSPFLALEELWVAKRFAEQVMGVGIERIALQLRQRALSEQEAVLVSPDYAPNGRAAELLGMVPASDDWRTTVEEAYRGLLNGLLSGGFKDLLVVGDLAFAPEDITERLVEAIRNTENSVLITPRATRDEGAQDYFEFISAFSVILPSRTVHEKTGVMINASGRLQQLQTLLEAPFGSFPDWILLKRLAKHCGKEIVEDSILHTREVFHALSKEHPGLSGISRMHLGEQGVSLDEIERKDQTEIRA